jgi:uncharacterized protein YjbI with pentapeptide repeats
MADETRHQTADDREPTPERPAPDGSDSWPAYWQAQGMPWRTEPEIDAERQRYLAERRAVKPNIERGIYPFRDENGSIKLTRADVEWLLATHESGGMRGPVDWGDEKQRWREGPDLRGADLRAIDLNHLPLTCLRGGPTREEWRQISLQKSRLAALRLERADLYGSQLQGAILSESQMQDANLWQTQLQGARLRHAQLQGAYLYGAQLQGADLRAARLDEATVLSDTTLDAETRLADVMWNGAPLSRVPWEQALVLGDEREAWRRQSAAGAPKDSQRRLWQFQAAVRANRQLAVALRAQGLSEAADRFAYRAQVLQRQVLRRQRRWGAAVGSWLLDALSGYGYQPVRSILAYVLIIGLFAGAYLLNAQFAAPHLTWDEALVLSISSFHGRGFFSSGISLGDTLARLAAGEAIIGLLIEITFIATFTQRFFAR